MADDELTLTTEEKIEVGAILATLLMAHMDELARIVSDVPDDELRAAVGQQVARMALTTLIHLGGIGEANANLEDAYVEVTVLAGGAVADVKTFHNRDAFAAYIEEIKTSASEHSEPVDVFCLYHEHPEGQDCECIQYETDHKPMWQFNQGGDQ